MTKGEWLTLLGMAMVVISAALTWKRDIPAIPASLGAQKFLVRHSFRQAAYDLPLGVTRVGWVLVFCAVACGALTLVEPSDREKRAFWGLQFAFSVIILLLAGINIGPYPGVALAIAGGLVLIYAAIARYR